MSIKSFVSGEALYEVGKGSFRLGADKYLVLNGGQEYSIIIDAATPVESFCVFIAPSLARSVQRSLTLPSTQLLDDPDVRSGSPPSFVERTCPHDGVVSPVLVRLRTMHARHRDEASWLEEGLHELMARLFRKHHDTLREAEDVQSLRASTREDLYRRLHLAREYAAACLDQSLTLDDLARVAGLSPNHLLRTFRSLFGQTPYQYIVAKRIERAEALLTTSDTSITEICFEVGWRSLGSFSFAFHRHTGLSPRAYRRQFGDIREVSERATPE